MKKNYWLILAVMLSTSLLAQQATSPAPSAAIETPAAAPAATLAPAAPKTNAPAAKKGKSKKKVGKKGAEKAPQKKVVAKKKDAAAELKKKGAAAELKTVPLAPGAAEVVATHVNVRGQPKLNSEVLTRLTKGQPVTVIEEIVQNNSGPDEPSAWAKIVLPAGAHVWVSSTHINTNNETIRARKLNLRSGPGENYSVIGRLQSGDAVKPVTTKGDWTEIEAPTNAYAFVAAQYLKQEDLKPAAPATTPTEPAAAVVAAVPPVATPPAAAPVVPTPAPKPAEPAPTPTTVAAGAPVAPPPTEAPTVPAPEPAPVVAVVAPVTPPPLVVVTPPPVVEDLVLPDEPPPPRIVQREGTVRGMTSIQAPSRFVLISVQGGRDIDYLFTTSKDLDLRRYKGMRVIVTGEEGLDERWPNMPVLTIQKIRVVE